MTRCVSRVRRVLLLLPPPRSVSSPFLFRHAERAGTPRTLPYRDCVSATCASPAANLPTHTTTFPKLQQLAGLVLHAPACRLLARGVLM